MNLIMYKNPKEILILLMFVLIHVVILCVRKQTRRAWNGVDSADNARSQADSPARTAACAPPGSSVASESAAPAHAMVTRTRDNTHTLLQRKDGTVTYDPSSRAFLATREPTNHREAVTSPEWCRAMSRHET